MLFKKSTLGEIVIITVNTGHFSAADALLLKTEVAMISALAELHILIDLTPVKRIDFASLGTLVTVLKSIGRRGSFSLCGLGKKVMERLHRTHLEHVFTVFPTRHAALQPDALGPYALSDVKALILCAGKGTRARPLSFDSPKPMLDVMGKPILHHCIDFLKSWGIRNVALNTSYQPESIEGYFGCGRSLGIKTVYSREGCMDGDRFSGRAVGSAASIQLIQQRFQYFDDDFVVMCGDALVDLDLNQMMRVHRRSGAIATIAAMTVPKSDVHKYGVIKSEATGKISSFQEKPAPEKALSCQVNTGIYIFSPRVLNFIPGSGDFDIGADLLPRLIEQNQHVQIYKSHFNWTDVGCIKDYYHANAKAVSGNINTISTSARMLRPNLWAEESATVSPKALIHGPTYVGRNAVVEADASLSGVSIIGAGSLISAKSYCRDSIVLPGTVLLAGAIVSGMCAGPNWCVRHSFAVGEVTEFEDMDRVIASGEPTDRQAPLEVLRA